MRRLLEYLVYRFFAFLLPLLPRGAVVWLGRRGGGLYYRLSARARATGMENLRRAFPDRDDYRRILVESLRLQGVALLDTLWSARLTPESAREFLGSTPDQESLLWGPAMGSSGAVVGTAHFGSWEMLNIAGAAIGIPKTTVIARPVRNLRIDRHFKKLRERTGNIIAHREGALVACLGALRRGEFVCSVIDMAVLPDQGGVFIDCLGTPALTPTALALLAVRRRAPLGFLVCRPVEKGRRYVMDMEQIEVRHDADRDEETLRLTLELNRALERRIREHPEAWIWSYKRWKYRPSELLGDYPTYSAWVATMS